MLKWYQSEMWFAEQKDGSVLYTINSGVEHDHLKRYRLLSPFLSKFFFYKKERNGRKFLPFARYLCLLKLGKITSEKRW